VGILDQISILRSPATADLKQDQYSTILVQAVECVLLRFTTLLSEDLVCHVAQTQACEDRLRRADPHYP
jgi:hypothetical protein